MADAVNKQILDAITTKLLGIAGIGTRVEDYLLDIDEVAGFPTLCFVATSEDTVDGVGVSSTNRKLWDMDVMIVGYVAGGDVRAKGYDLVKLAEAAIEADPGLGIAGVEQARVVAKAYANMGPKDEMSAFVARVELLVNCRYRYVTGAP